jgi:methyl-accepting chemotaxis protein
MNILKNLGIGAKLALGFAVVLVLVSLVSTISYKGVGNMIQSSHWVNHTYKVIRIGESVSAAMIDMETGLRGFLVTGDENYLEPYHAGKKRFDTLIDEGAELTSDNPAQVERWNNVKSMEAKWLGEWAQPQIERRKQVLAGAKATAHFKEVSARILGKQLFDGVRHKIALLNEKIPNDQVYDKYLLTNMTLALVNMETGQRGYLLSGVEASLEPYVQGKKDLLKYLDSLSADYPSDVDTIMSAVEDWQNRVAEVEINARRVVNQFPLTMDDIIADLATGIGKQHMDAIRAELNDIVTAEEELIIVRNKDQEDTASFTSNFSLYGTLLAILISIVIAVFITRSIRNPVADMARLMKKIDETGDFSLRLNVDGKDEVSTASQSINTLLSSLQHAIKEANETMVHMSEGDCSHPMKGNYQGDLEKLKNGVNTSLTQVSHAMEGLMDSLQALSGANFNHKTQVNGNVKGTYRKLMDQSSTTMSNLNMAISDILKVMEGMSHGDFSQRITVEMSGDLQTLKDQMNRSLQELDHAIKEVSIVMEAQGAGDLTQNVKGQYEGQLKTLSDDLNLGIVKTSNMIGEVVAASTEVRSGASQISQGTNDLSDRTQNQATSVEETAASMEQMAAAIQETTSNAQRANQLSEEARVKAADGAQIMQNTINAMDGISEASSQIAEIVTLIDSIAFQTNLLALNAAVEAARAGEHGRGFAVVAGEVRTLAQKSADAAKDIKSLIDNSTHQITQGTQLVSQSGEALNEINNSIQQVSEIVSEITTAAQEQSSGISQVNNAISTIDSSTQQNAALVEETAAAASTMEQEASNLLSLVSQFKTHSTGRLPSK